MDLTKYLYWLIRQPQGSVKWYATQSDLIELIGLVGGKKVITDNRGKPLTQTELARRAFNAIGKKAPKDFRVRLFHIHERVFPKPPLEKRIQPPTDEIYLNI